MRNSTFMSRFQEWLDDWNEDRTRNSLIILLAVLAGLLIGLIVYTVGKLLLYDLFPRPPAIDYRDGEEAAKLLNTEPVTSYWVVVISWLLATLGGAYCATRVAKFGQFPGWLAGILLGAFYLVDLLFQPHTLLIFLICPIFVGIAAYGGGWAGAYINGQKMSRTQSIAPVVTPEM